MTNREKYRWKKTPRSQIKKMEQGYHPEEITWGKMSESQRLAAERRARRSKRLRPQDVVFTRWRRVTPDDVHPDLIEFDRLSNYTVDAVSRMMEISDSEMDEMFPNHDWHRAIVDKHSEPELSARCKSLYELFQLIKPPDAREPLWGLAVAAALTAENLHHCADVMSGRYAGGMYEESLVKHLMYTPRGYKHVVWSDLDRIEKWIKEGKL